MFHFHHNPKTTTRSFFTPKCLFTKNNQKKRFFGLGKNKRQLSPHSSSWSLRFSHHWIAIFKYWGTAVHILMSNAQYTPYPDASCSCMYGSAARFFFDLRPIWPIRSIGLLKVWCGLTIYVDGEENPASARCRTLDLLVRCSEKEKHSIPIGGAKRWFTMVQPVTSHQKKQIQCFHVT